MRPTPLFLLLGWLLLGVGTATPAWAQQHRATRLGNPAHRFARPLQKPEDLRALFANPKLRGDIESVLRQAGWTGDVEDLRQAAAKAEIIPVMVAPGTRLPFMSTRRGGKPVALIDVLWAGKEPFSAYEFEFVSRGHRYHCVTPKACANFLVVDLGPVASVELARVGPSEVTVCTPFEVGFVVRNTGGARLSGVQIRDPLPACLSPLNGERPNTLPVGDLAPGESREVRVPVRATASGGCEQTARVESAQGAMAAIPVQWVVRAPVIHLDCAAPAEVLAGRPARVCLSVRNTGDAPEPKVTVRVPIPPGASLGTMSGGGRESAGQVVWELTEVAPGSVQELCATFTRLEPGPLPLTASATCGCAGSVEAGCETKVSGIPAILLEVVDLEDPVEVGNPVVYEIRVTNQGTGALTQVALVCALAETQEFVSGEGATPVVGEQRQATLAPLARLEPKATALWRVTVKAIGQADARFRVDLTSDQFSRPVEEFEATSQY